MLVSAILDGQIPPGGPLPSCRSLAQSLKIARNTVVLAYQDLVEEGFLIARERSGFFANPDILSGRVRSADVGEQAGDSSRLRCAPGPTGRTGFGFIPATQRNIVKPANWQDYPYPFIYGQVDQGLFPSAAWRECSRQALSVTAVRDWSKDRFADDDPLLIEQIRTRLLPRRGVRVAADEILVTVGAQNALYLIASLLFDRDTVFGIENPGLYRCAQHREPACGPRRRHRRRRAGHGAELRVRHLRLRLCDAEPPVPDHRDHVARAAARAAGARGRVRRRPDRGRLRERARPPGQPAAGAEIARSQRPRHLRLVACRRRWRRACAWASWSGRRS